MACAQLISLSIRLLAFGKTTFRSMARLTINSTITKQSDADILGTATDRGTEQPDSCTSATEQWDNSVRAHSQAGAFRIADESFFDARNAFTCNVARTKRLLSAIENMLCAQRELDVNLHSLGIEPRDDFETAILAYTDHLRELRDHINQKLEQMDKKSSKDESLAMRNYREH